MVVTVMTFPTASLFTQHYTDYLLRSLQGPIPHNDSELLRYIRDEVLHEPSSEPYNLLGENSLASRLRVESELFYNKSLRAIFKDKRDGFFVEAGALDGETMSNTLWLEVEQGWTGLLVEADSAAFLALNTKYRRAWAANVCLSPDPYPSKEIFNQLPHYSGPSAVPIGYKIRAMNSLLKFSPDTVRTLGLEGFNEILGNSWFEMIQCLPLESILLAMGVRQVDLLVLDVEGAEMAILGHFDLRQFNVQVLCIEWKHRSELDSVSQKFSQRGYKEVARAKEDLILVKQDSPYTHVKLMAH
ncbi:hypothetical protein Pmani_025553 [Petrolisthes manimaculis]|uniref:Methyltransferase FkbM domain-containing protein n=1 Tax=Petrolisthes manimaculis TaxID=1843537 RepID=A0AAE1P5Y7_9EUCA|nr:hypothetical protein Pmani_025553 [Petrolisthes manimaculis]